MDGLDFMAKNEINKWMIKNRMVCITIYASDTDLFAPEEIDELVNSPNYYTEMIDIPVPYNLLYEWYCRNGDYSVSNFEHWLYEESTADDADGLYYWLKKHNYCWKRLK